MGDKEINRAEETRRAVQNPFSRPNDYSSVDVKQRWLWRLSYQSPFFAKLNLMMISFLTGGIKCPKCQERAMLLIDFVTDFFELFGSTVDEKKLFKSNWAVACPKCKFEKEGRFSIQEKVIAFFIIFIVFFPVILSGVTDFGNSVSDFIIPLAIGFLAIKLHYFYLKLRLARALKEPTA